MGWTQYRCCDRILIWSLIAGISLACTPVSEAELTAPTASTPVQEADEPKRTISLPTLPFSKQTATIDTLHQRQDDTVTISGEVRRQVPLVEAQLYQVQDGTGSVWVALAGEAADVALGDRVTVRGTVRYQDIQIEGSNLSEYYLQAEQLQSATAAVD